MRVLVAAAYPPELEGLAARLRLPASSTMTVACEAVGIGLLAAAVGAARALTAHAPDLVLLVGTCGIYPAALGQVGQVGEVVLLGSTALVDPALVRGDAATLPSVSAELTADPRLGARIAAVLPRLATVRVATTASLTTSDAVADALGASWDVEHLEAAAVATACRAANVPFAALLGIANRVGSTGRDEWRQHREAAERATSAAAVTVLTRLATG